MRNLLTALCTLLLFPLLLSAQGDASYGGASMYADAYHGRPTASGEPYDKNKLTGAHKTLPFGTIVKVINLENKKTVEVRINDRGPFIKGRIIDLSRKAAERLGMANTVAKVKMEISGKGASSAPVTSTPAPKSAKEAKTTVAEAKPQPKVKVVPKTKKEEAKPTEFTEKSPLPEKKKPVLVEAVDKSVETKKSATAKAKKEDKPKVAETTAKPKEEVKPKKPADTMAPKGELVTAKNFKANDLYKVSMVRPEKKGFGVQVATFKAYENVMRKVAELQGKWFSNILVNVEQGESDDTTYKIILGPFEDRESADNYKKALKKNKKMDGFVVSLGNEE